MQGYVLPVVNRFNNIHICFISNVGALLPLRFSMARFMNATLIYSTLIISVVIGKITDIFYFNKWINDSHVCYNKFTNNILLTRLLISF